MSQLLGIYLLLHCIPEMLLCAPVDWVTDETKSHRVGCLFFNGSHGPKVVTVTSCHATSCLQGGFDNRNAKLLVFFKMLSISEGKNQSKRRQIQYQIALCAFKPLPLHGRGPTLPESRERDRRQVRASSTTKMVGWF